MSVNSSKHQILPVMPLREMVVFPNSITPLFVTRPQSLAALDEALANGKKLFLATQKSSETERPTPKDLHLVGCVAEVLQVFRSHDNTAKVLVEGRYTGRLVDFFTGEACLKAYVSLMEFPIVRPEEIEPLRRTVLRQFEIYAQYCDNIPEELERTVKQTSDPLDLANAVANYASFSTAEKQKIMELESVDEKLLHLSQILTRENELLEVEHKIISQVKDQISSSQKEYFLNEQLKVIEKELGLNSDEDAELDDLYEQIAKSKMSEEARERAVRELNRMARMAPMSPESTVSRTYVEWILDLPWGIKTKDKLNLKRAQRVLDEDHYGLEKVKQRVIEFLAVLQLVEEMKGPILCFVGPPGVGKTSLARSIARAIGRNFVRVSLGGVRDEAEIRGHRRTYIGSLPGKIIQYLKKAGSQNPVFLLDEIDKMGVDFRGDPSSALLEALDPEQNKAFNDHYLEVDYDLSNVMFITTANTTERIPPALLDRMEIIRLPGYTEIEKRHIAQQFLAPKQIKAHGLSRSSVRFGLQAFDALIHNYTREAGVRQLEREIASICRKAARETVKAGKRKRITINPAKVREYLGPPKFTRPRVEGKPEIGVATGLAWTEVGGELLPVETSTMPGSGKLLLTGKLGEVMQESAKAAMSYIRARTGVFGIPADFHEKLDVHVHIPEGAIPKDGPSAGIALVAAMVSALSGRPVRQDVAMTGEITLRGNILKIGGLKEKALAAHRSRIRRLIIPAENRDDLEELPREIRDDFKFTFAATIEDGLEAAMAPEPKSKAKTPKAPRKKPAGRRPAVRRRQPRVAS